MHTHMQAHTLLPRGWEATSNCSLKKTENESKKGEKEHFNVLNAEYAIPFQLRHTHTHAHTHTHTHTHTYLLTEPDVHRLPVAADAVQHARLDAAAADGSLTPLRHTHTHTSHTHTDRHTHVTLPDHMNGDSTKV